MQPLHHTRPWCPQMDSNHRSDVRSVRPSSRRGGEVERTAGVEPAFSGWEPGAQPLRHARTFIKEPWHRWTDSNRLSRFWRPPGLPGSPAQLGLSDGIRTRVNAFTARPLNHSGTPNIRTLDRASDSRGDLHADRARALPLDAPPAQTNQWRPRRESNPRLPGDNRPSCH